jgi:uncharacterized protein (DUF1499 family)
LLAAIIAAVAVAATGPAYRAGLDLGTVFFVLFPTGVYAAMAAGALAVIWLIVAVVQRSLAGAGLVVIALVLAAGAAAFPLTMRATGQSVPPIHDITTDTENPPVFIAVLPLRKDAPNTVEYGGPELAAQQKKGYPELAPAVLPMPPRAAFELALEAARRSGWEIVAAVPDDNRIEATATTDWFGFKDDIVIRIRPVNGGSRVDMRSVSRVGRSDLGTNARRIREYLRQLTAAKAG